MHYARITKEDKCAKLLLRTSKDRVCFGELNLDGNFNVQVDLEAIGEGSWNSVTRPWVNKSGWFSKEGKVHSGCKKCTKYLVWFGIFPSRTSLDLVISFPTPERKVQTCNLKQLSVLTNS